MITGLEFRNSTHINALKRTKSGGIFVDAAFGRLGALQGGNSPLDHSIEQSNSTRAPGLAGFFDAAALERFSRRLESGLADSEFDSGQTGRASKSLILDCIGFIFPAGKNGFLRIHFIHGYFGSYQFIFPRKYTMKNLLERALLAYCRAGYKQGSLSARCWPDYSKSGVYKYNARDYVIVRSPADDLLAVYRIRPNNGTLRRLLNHPPALHDPPKEGSRFYFKKS